ncbi:MAG: hypothetical protein A2V90_07560 [Gammaproteobacteria bacterium RBG_16_57_12]|nr:MAG: hypothetical protein A2V90_07560 [Gammaproteobacteria bacterium RBG_16_57_12]
MSKDKPDIDNPEHALFRDAVGPVTPVKNRKLAKPALKRTKQRPPPLPHKAAEHAASSHLLQAEHLLSAADTVFHARSGIQAKLLRKLRRGQIPVTAQLDLHGQTLAQAETSLQHFLNQCRQHRLRCVRIIHGKGYGSATGQPVLKNHLPLWLQAQDQVLAFCSAPPAQGGTGALLVLLRLATRESRGDS